MSTTLTWTDIALRLACTAVAAFLIGWDRGEHAHPAGMRTNMVIAVAAALIMIQASWLTIHLPELHKKELAIDPMRLPMGVLTGVGFIGGGVILRRGEMVRGVTSAATIWAVTIIGLCFGGGQIAIGAAGTAIILAALWLMKYAEAAIITARRGTLAVTFATPGLHAPQVFAVLEARGFSLRSHSVQRMQDGGTRIECHGRYSGAYPEWPNELVRELAARPDIARVDWSEAD